jgi:hypothetical protein
MPRVGPVDGYVGRYTRTAPRARCRMPWAWPVDSYVGRYTRAAPRARFRMPRAWPVDGYVGRYTRAAPRARCRMPWAWPMDGYVGRLALTSFRATSVKHHGTSPWHRPKCGVDAYRARHLARNEGPCTMRFARWDTDSGGPALTSPVRVWSWPGRRTC